MAIHEKHSLLAREHAFGINITDDFGHEHTVKIPTHVAVEDTEHPFPLGPITLLPEYEKQLENIRKMMRDRELAFLEACLQHPHHRADPLVLAHPDHPKNKGQ